MAEPTVTLVRCGGCNRSDDLSLLEGRFWCGWCQRWADVTAERVCGATVVQDGDVLRLAPVKKSSDWLQPLRVPPSWHIERNLLPDAELDPVSESHVGGRNLLFATNDSARRAIDVDWRVEPGPPIGGAYVLRLLLMVEETPEYQQHHCRIDPLQVDWRSPLHQFETISRPALVAELEACLRGERG